ncbi:MAG: type II secretion system F family protein [Acidimicrobiia bacterium]
MTAYAIAVGLGIGAGVLLIVSGLRPRPASLTDIEALLSRTGTSVTAARTQAAAAAVDDGEWRIRAGRAGLRTLGRFGVDVGELTQKLRLLDKPVETHVWEKLFAAGAGFVLPILVGLVVTAGGVAISPIALLGASAVLATLGFFYPDLPLNEQVEARRREFRHALSSFLDLVTIIQAGGGGIETALVGAADAGDGWAFEQLRDALRRSRLTRRTPWDTLAALGEDLGIDELTQLAAAVSLAGGHGARVKESLTAKADALRAALAAEVEAAAESQTEKMIVPVMVMILGLVLFIGYGAVEAISNPSADLVTEVTDR